MMPFLIQLDSFEAILFEFVHFPLPEIPLQQAHLHFECFYQFDEYLIQYHSKDPLEFILLKPIMFRVRVYLPTRLRFE